MVGWAVKQGATTRLGWLSPRFQPHLPAVRTRRHTFILTGGRTQTAESVEAAESALVTSGAYLIRCAPGLGCTAKIAGSVQLAFLNARCTDSLTLA